MARFFFVVIPEKGHLHPMLGPAGHLRDRGHEVIFHAGAPDSRALRATLSRAGFEHFEGLEPAESPRYPSADRRSEDRGAEAEAAGEPLPTRGRALAEKLDDGPWLRQWIERLLLDTVPGHAESLQPLLARLEPDVVVADPMVYAAVLASERADLPWAAVSNSLNPVLPAAGDLDSELLRTVRALAAKRDALFARYGVRCAFSGCDALSPRLTVAFTTEALVGEPVPGVEMVGPSEPVGRRGDEPEGEDLLGMGTSEEDDRPSIVLSFGSQAYFQPERFRSVIEAVRGRDVRLTLSIGDMPIEALGVPLPPNVVAKPYLPQLHLLDRAAVLVTHGGANSVMEALARAVPILISPLCNDQFHQAHFLERSGAGRRLDLPASPETVWQALESLLRDGSERRNTRRIADDYARHDGARRAADLLEGLLEPAFP